jgi:hypothetical protein
MVMCGRDVSCGGCMDVDNKNVPMSKDAPLDVNGQLTQPMRKDVKDALKQQKTMQWAD